MGTSYEAKKFIKLAALILGITSSSTNALYAKTYLTVDQAKKVLLKDISTKTIEVILTKDQIKSIAKASKVRVNNNRLNAQKTENGGWFIIDQVVGKHENIDIAVTLTKDGKVGGIEVLTYRETYGGEVMNPKWLAQFFGKGNDEHLKLDEQIKNISGATLSCRHITDGINRLTHTWDQVLRYL
ncbi:MAG: Na+-translocating ferredoxin:NAD+ oxidoreductase RnfG subunit [Rickettsiales bacterium]|jgi:Na+-translocating ferredoxin:NAD+ oxidoreductase RnfG subunit